MAASTCGFDARPWWQTIQRADGSITETVALQDIDDPLSLKPPRVILAFIRGGWVASISVVATIGGGIAARYGAWSPAVSMQVLTAVAVFWLGSAVWLTPSFTIPPPRHREWS